MAKSLLESLLKDCNALHEDEFNLTAGDKIEVTDDSQENEVIEPVIDADLEDGSTPSSYVNKNVIFCNICLKPFFSDTDVQEDTVCPTCSASSEDLVLVGKVVKPETTDNEEGENTSADDVPAEDDNSEVNDSEEKIPEESVKKKGDKVNEDVTVTVNTDASNVNVDTSDANVAVNADSKTEVPSESEEDEEDDEDEEDEESDISNFEYEEESFNKIFTKFLTDNYSNVKSFNLIEAKMSNNVLTLEGVITYNEGSTRNVTIKTDEMNLSEGVSKVKAACPLFGKSKAFVLEHKLENNKLEATKMLYRYKTRFNNESYNVVGKVVLE